jgi:hypothetical protein
VRGEFGLPGTSLLVFGYGQNQAPDFGFFILFGYALRFHDLKQLSGYTALLVGTHVNAKQSANVRVSQSRLGSRTKDHVNRRFELRHCRLSEKIGLIGILHCHEGLHRTENLHQQFMLARLARN